MRRSFLFAQLALLLPLGFFPYLISEISSTVPPIDAVEQKSEKQIKQWIEELESDSFETRETATHTLMNLEYEPPGLRKELKSPDPEVRRRVAKILEAYVPKRARRGLAKVKVLAKEGRVDEMVEQLVLWKQYDTAEGWKALTELAAKLATRADFAYDKTHFCRVLKPEERGESNELVYDKMTFQWVNKPLEGRNLTKETKEELTSKNLAKQWQSVFEPLRDEKITIDKPGQGSRKIFIASGDVEIDHLSQGVIAVGGNVQLGQVSNSVVICDGECKFKDQIQESLIIARGKVTCPQRVGANHSVILGEDFIDMPGSFRISWSIISNGSPNGFVKFFNPFDVGISSGNVLDKKGKVVPDGTQIFEVRDGTSFTSRLQPKDVVTAIDETRTPTFDVFRRVLRRKIAEALPVITFTVRRAGKTLEVPIAMKD